MRTSKHNCDYWWGYHGNIVVAMATIKRSKFLRNVVARDTSSYTPPNQQNSLVIPPLDKKYPGYTTVRPFDPRCQSGIYIYTNLQLWTGALYVRI